jgi:hypothetical protein
MDTMNDTNTTESDVQAVEKLGEARDGVVKELRKVITPLSPLS